MKKILIGIGMFLSFMAFTHLSWAQSAQNYCTVNIGFDPAVWKDGKRWGGFFIAHPGNIVGTIGIQHETGSFTPMTLASFPCSKETYLEIHIVGLEYPKQLYSIDVEQPALQGQVQADSWTYWTHYFGEIDGYKEGYPINAPLVLAFPGLRGSSNAANTGAYFCYAAAPWSSCRKGLQAVVNQVPGE